ncbi:hypothetical protein JTB14_007218 [Gonioctena quinquepunctata]|nr:hypothetical protein JTB14_007218 [Gonioctena quinquepunctata]
MVEKIPQSFEDTILFYLRGQEIWPEDFNIHLEAKVDNPAENIHDILDDLLLKVHKRIACKDRYENLKQWHNQYPLFDLSVFIKDFCIDEEMMQKLAFREVLLISEIDSIAYSEYTVPQPVGALCLNVSRVDGHMSEKPLQRATGAELDYEIFKTWQRAKQASINTKYSNVENEGDDLDNKLEEDLKAYEYFLKNEMKQNVKKFVVHLSSQFDIGSNAGSRITAWVDRNFHTLEEKRTEYVEEVDKMNEKSIYIAMQDNKYYMRTTSLKDKLEERKYFSLEKACKLVAEGANFILMRYLAITRYHGQFELSTVHINGGLCRNIYECTGPMKGTVNGEEIEVCKIYRYIIEEFGIEHHCVTVLTVHGRIVTQEWEGCNYILDVNPLQILSKGKFPYDKFILEKTWMEDMELLSKYLDCKTEAELKMETYMSDQPDVKDILADYLNNILLLKPEHILTFTEDFFQSLCPIRIARMGYLDTDKSEYDKIF